MNKYRLLRIIMLILGIVLLTIGIATGDFANVFRKASKICYECIGIG